MRINANIASLNASRNLSVSQAGSRPEMDYVPEEYSQQVSDYLGNFQPDTYDDVTAAPVELDEDGNPIEGYSYTLALPDGGKREGTTDDQEIRAEGIDPGDCVFKLSMAS